MVEGEFREGGVVFICRRTTLHCNDLKTLGAFALARRCIFLAQAEKVAVFLGNLSRPS